MLTKVCIVKVMFFPSGHIWMWELDYKEGWAPKNWCFQTLVLEKTLESPLDSKEIKPITPKGNQPWIFIERTAAQAEAPILWLPGTESWLIGKDPDAGKDWRQKRRGAAEDEMVEWHHRLNGHGQGRLACCHSWGHKESDVTEQLENNNHTLPPLPCSLLSYACPLMVTRWPPQLKASLACSQEGRGDGRCRGGQLCPRHLFLSSESFLESPQHISTHR